MKTEITFQKIQGHQYQSKDAFIADIQLILDNSIRYNGKDHSFTATARKMIDVCLAAMQEVSVTCQAVKQDMVVLSLV